ncbi:putative short chain type dehydrogenase [Aaosphaeria arxii CBS 175.79]|uniref:Putative short chain type dehydrogenase n=1 Tax=Aaosphaeria arxii CBS 175.79 TaxID=1450172 RepID=A0A6A5XBH6_9PLEO|nr:putative short chain type dehydrogenase [Aaosphaeria arxii CBS 175.79]KAF2010312.1 putative short chain type dehydrogenase [Aaosphaeria arxii CBS 175.79]
MTGRLANKIAVITGSSSGIGRAIAILYASEGASIVCSDIREDSRPEKAEETTLTTVQEVEKLGAKAIFVKCDTSQTSDVQNLITQAVSHFGRVDIMVNNAGIGIEGSDPRPIWDYPEEYWDKTQAVNLRGVFLGTKYAALQMRKQEPHANGDRGWIVNLGSVLGLNGSRQTAGYVASKHGVVGLTKTAAWDCAEDRIHVNAICPGCKYTYFLHGGVEAMHPFRGIGSAKDVARIALFLASDDAAWVTGIGLPVDGGYNSM